MRSKSRGDVRLASADPHDPPRIRFNYMSHPDDWTEIRACVRLTREIFAQPAFDPYRGREIQPGRDVVEDDAIDAFVRDRLESAYHPAGSCRMGDPADPRTVVDPQGRVVGLEGLRVVDSSIMPTLTTGNLNAPTIMIGEKAADAILGRDPLPGLERALPQRCAGSGRAALALSRPPLAACVRRSAGSRNAPRSSSRNADAEANPQDIATVSTGIAVWAQELARALEAQFQVVARRRRAEMF